MKKETANSKIIGEILRLARNPERVRVTQVVQYDLMGLGLTKFDACDAICDWIDKGKEVRVITTKYAKGHIGEPQYVMKPIIESKQCYIKVTFQKTDASQENLLIISTHIDH